MKYLETFLAILGGVGLVLGILFGQVSTHSGHVIYQGPLYPTKGS